MAARRRRLYLDDAGYAHHHRQHLADNVLDYYYGGAVYDRAPAS